MCYASVAIDAFGKGDLQALAQPLRWAIAYRSLGFRFGAMNPPKGNDVVQLHEFVTSLKAIGPALLGEWDEAAGNAALLLAYAEAEQQRNAFPGSGRHKRWGKGTHDAFVIALLAQAFDLGTTYTPENPLIEAYQGLLMNWRTTDLAIFQQAMAPAVAFHLARGRYSTDKVEYEFDEPFDRVFPAELLLVQALRQRDGLPAFASGHALVDAPWAAISQLPDADQPPPLLAQTLARLQADYPQFR
ncbi:hypothetical protein [Stenotrophomonas ginsengisoli]|uniref:hypothetical protein n=1 Tax=Stenotrophomonas ginsengisoli TaxID=336566 RepID=UPI00070CB8C5|nr:hypothetical protein [Stenotrophomonas ginsengisoli]